MGLQGTIEAFGLDDGLRLLASTAQTGQLHVRGDAGVGRVQLADGDVVAAVSTRAPAGPPVEAVADLLGLRVGEFTFEPGDDGFDGALDPVPVERLLTDADVLREEWDGLRELCPSLDHEARLVGQLPGDAVTIDAGLWPAVAVLGQRRPVGELAAAFGLGELGALRLVSHLVDLGVATVESPP
jgi:hypothetical protein